jgi:hypothetical protein
MSDQARFWVKLKTKGQMAFTAQQILASESPSAFISQARRSMDHADRLRLFEDVLAVRQHGATHEKLVEAVVALPTLGSGRNEQARLALRAAAVHEGFRDAAGHGDHARDAHDWREGRDAYLRALALFPLHFGYRVQYAHCMKEMGHWIEAEIGYRDALAHGAPFDDVVEHLEFVFRRLGVRYRSVYPEQVYARLSGAEDAGADSLDGMTDSRDVGRLTTLFWGELVKDPAENVRHLRAAPLLDQFVEHVVGADAFTRNNLSLLSLAARRAQAANKGRQP